jgi:hypothetical protein
MPELLKSSLPLLLLLSFCACVSTAHLAGTALVSVIAFAGLEEIVYLLPPLWSLASLCCWLWIERVYFAGWPTRGMIGSPVIEANTVLAFGLKLGADA